MEEFDTNRDGKISFEEFQNALVKIKERLDAKARTTK